MGVGGRRGWFCLWLTASISAHGVPTNGGVRDCVLAGTLAKGDKLILMLSSRTHLQKRMAERSDDSSNHLVGAVFMPSFCIKCAVNERNLEEENLPRWDQCIRRPCTVSRFISIWLTY